METTESKKSKEAIANSETDALNDVERQNSTKLSATKDKEEYFGQLDKDGKAHGTGRLIYSSSDLRQEYVGGFSHGLRQGYGILKWKDDCVFSGEWFEDVQKGFGQMKFNQNDQHNRERYEGEWANGKRNGIGTLFFKNGERYEGQWKDDLYHGKGEFSWLVVENESFAPPQRVYFSGEWIQGKKQDDVGTITHSPQFAKKNHPIKRPSSFLFTTSSENSNSNKINSLFLQSKSQEQQINSEDNIQSGNKNNAENNNNNVSNTNEQLRLGSLSSLDTKQEKSGSEKSGDEANKKSSKKKKKQEKREKKDI